MNVNGLRTAEHLLRTGVRGLLKGLDGGKCLAMVVNWVRNGEVVYELATLKCERSKNKINI
jgi:hypothetical protein